MHHKLSTACTSPGKEHWERTAQAKTRDMKSTDIRKQEAVKTEEVKSKDTLCQQERLLPPVWHTPCQQWLGAQWWPPPQHSQLAQLSWPGGGCCSAPPHPRDAPWLGGSLEPHCRCQAALGMWLGLAGSALTPICLDREALVLDLLSIISTSESGQLRIPP